MTSSSAPVGGGTELGRFVLVVEDDVVVVVAPVVTPLESSIEVSGSNPVASFVIKEMLVQICNAR